jgi:hypothetical protein
LLQHIAVRVKALRKVNHSTSVGQLPGAAKSIRQGIKQAAAVLKTQPTKIGIAAIREHLSQPGGDIQRIGSGDAISRLAVAVTQTVILEAVVIAQ